MARASRTSQARAARQAKMLYDMCAMAIVAGRADLDGADEVGFDIELPMFTVGRAGELANVHPQTLRQYDRLGLVVPQRTDGGARRYSLRDIARLAKSQQLSQEEGINLAGIARILSLEEENRELRILEGDIPSPVNPPQGCKFHTRCAHCTEICKHAVPEWKEMAPGHFVACHHPLSEKE